MKVVNAGCIAIVVSASLFIISSVGARTIPSVAPQIRRASGRKSGAAERSRSSTGQSRHVPESDIERSMEKTLNQPRYTADPGEEVLSNRIPKLRNQIPHPTPDRVTTGTPQTFTVTTTGDTGAGSFRKAIHDANANPGPDTIKFNIGGGGVQTIVPTTYFEVITSPLVIDGTTQPGYVDHPLIEFAGYLQNSIYPDFLEIDCRDVTIRGLDINRFPRNGIVIDTSGGDVIEGNFVGTDPTGEISQPNGQIGIGVSGPYNRIGGTTPGAGNVIQGQWQNIEILGNDPSWLAASHDNVIQGNIIGLDAGGTQNIQYQVQSIGGGAITILGSYNDTIGGSAPGARNVISGNRDGIYLGGYDHLQNTVPSYGSVVQGNLIGLDITGRTPVGNIGNGLTLYNSYNNLVGGTTSGARNVFANNALNGIKLKWAFAFGNIIQGNYIGTDTSGTLVPFHASANGQGIYSSYSHDNLIGGSAANAGNVISGNLGNGIYLDSMSQNFTVQGNLIGVTRSTTKLNPAGNLENGILLHSVPHNNVGGANPGEGNTIGSNTSNGIVITGDSSAGNIIVGNSIGTDVEGILDLGNGGNGILVDASNTTIGGSAAGAKNAIQYNGTAGIYFLSGVGNRISQNGISENGLLGIDISPTGPNLNDSLDADTGPNTMQNFPVIDSVIHPNVFPPATLIKGHLNSVPNNGFRLEFFESSRGDTSHYGEGETFLGFTDVTTDPSGNMVFSYTGPSTPDYALITATATDTAGNTSEFSRDLKPITILNPAGGELWVTQEPDTIAWMISGRIDSVTIGYSLDSGATYYSISNARGNQGDYVWFPPKGTLSKKCRIAVWDQTNFDVGDTSGTFRIKGYVLTRDSGGQYVAFDPARDGWRFPNDSPYIFPASWYNQFDYTSAIDPNTGASYPLAMQLLGKKQFFPDWPDFVQAFGQNQCYFSVNPPIYRPTAINRWLGLQGPWNGSCFGFANTSFMAFDSAALFQTNFPAIPGFNHLFDIDTSAAVRNVINSLMTRQFGLEGQQAIISGRTSITPLQTLADIKQMLLDENRDDRILALFNQNGRGGHVVNPYKVETDANNPNDKWIYVYDNNDPGSTTDRIMIDSASDFWTYLPLSTWGGTRGLFLLNPASDFYNIQTLRASTAVAVARKLRSPNALSGDYEILNNASMSVRIISTTGDSIGYTGSTVFSTIANAAPNIPLTGFPSPPIGYFLPPTGSYAVTLSNCADTTLHFTAFTDSSVFGVRRRSVTPADVDHLIIGNALDYVNYDNTTKSPDFEAIIMHGDNERVLTLKDARLHVGDSIHIDVVNRQNLHVVNNNDTLHYNLHIEYASAAGVIPFDHANLAVPPHAAIQVVPAWDSMAYSPAKVLIDPTNSGAYTDSVSLDNESSSYYPDSMKITPPAITGGKIPSGTVFLNAPAPYGGFVAHLTSSAPAIASVPSTVYIPVGSQSIPFSITTQVVALPDTVMITVTANGVSHSDTLAVLPQGIESLSLNPAGGVIGGDSAQCTVLVSNPAPSGGTSISLSSANPALVQVPPSVTVTQGNVQQQFEIHTATTGRMDSVLITANSGARQASVLVHVSPFGYFKISPDTIVGGNPSALIASIGVPAPPAGVTFTFGSSDSAIAWAHSPLTIGAGYMSNSTPITTSGVDADSTVYITVVNAPSPTSLPMLVRPAGLSSISDYSNSCFVGQRTPVSRRKYIAGNIITFTASLNGPAPTTGAQIHVSSDHPDLLPVDSIAVIPHNSWNGSLSATSNGSISAVTQIAITMTYRGQWMSDTVMIVPRLNYTVVTLDSLSNVGQPVGVNNRGDVLMSNGYLWNNGNVIDLHSFPGFHLGSVNAINDSGWIAGEVYPNAALWHKDTTIVFPNPAGIVRSYATAMNNHGDIVCAMTAGGQYDTTGCVWRNGVRILLDNYDSQHYLRLSSINDSGDVAGTAYPLQYPYGTSSAAVLWKNGHIAWSITGFATYYNDAYYPYASVLNDSGVLGGEIYTTPGLVSRGWFLERGNDTISFDALPPYYGTYLMDMNNHGDIVGEVWEDDNESAPMGFMYADGYYYDLNCLADNIPAGYEIATAFGINENRLVVGWLHQGYVGQWKPCILVPAGVPTGVRTNPGAQRIPTEYGLSQNYPNPFNPATTINYQLPHPSLVRLSIYNVIGQKVATLVEGVEQAGYRSATWNASIVASGVYFYRIDAVSTADPTIRYTQVKKMLLLK